jgi:hypothetical protein
MIDLASGVPVMSSGVPFPFPSSCAYLMNFTLRLGICRLSLVRFATRRVYTRIELAYLHVYEVIFGSALVFFDDFMEVQGPLCEPQEQALRVPLAIEEHI